MTFQHSLPGLLGSIGRAGLGAALLWVLVAAAPSADADGWPRVDRDRFVVTFVGMAVFDRETSLIWQRMPDDAMTRRTYEESQRHCLNLALGGRRGWRLPSPHELTTLFDPAQSNPALPAGHPFRLAQGAGFGSYWSNFVTFDEDPLGDVQQAIFADSATGLVDTGDGEDLDVAGAWCVRGPGATFENIP